MNTKVDNKINDHLRSKLMYIKDRSFVILCFVSTMIGILSVLGLILYVFYDSIGWLDLQFLSSSPSRFPEKAGVYPMLMGSFFLIAMVAVFSLPVGVGAAIHLEEYMGDNFFKRVIEVNISNLAGVPSIVYGLLGLGIFIRVLGFGPGIVLVGALTLTLRILPVVIVASQEAIKAVPDSLREASIALGASRWQMIRTVVLPESIPGIMTGTILALANAIGETAPLIMIGVATSIFTAPTGLFSPTGALPLQIFAWSDFPKVEFQHGVNPAAIVTLLVVLFIMILSAVIIRNKFQKYKV